MTLNNYKLVTISKLVDGKFEGDKAASINRISIDSRTRFAGEGTLFIALKGENRDGHNFIKDAFDKGVRNFLVKKFSSSLKAPILLLSTIRLWLFNCGPNNTDLSLTSQLLQLQEAMGKQSLKNGFIIF